MKFDTYSSLYYYLDSIIHVGSTTIESYNINKDRMGSIMFSKNGHFIIGFPSPLMESDPTWSDALTDVSVNSAYSEILPILRAYKLFNIGIE